MKFTLMIMALTGLFCIVESYNILMVIYVASRSHKQVMEPLAKGLAERGHQVTFFNPFPKTSKDIPNLKEVIPSELTSGMEGVNRRFQSRDPPNKLKVLFKFFDLSMEMCDIFLSSPETHQLLKSKFDIVLIDGFVNDCAIGLAYRLQVPFAYVTPATLLGWQAMGTKNPLPSSVIPFGFTPYTNQMTFWQRVINFVYSNVGDLIRLYYGIPHHDHIMRKHLGQDLPSLADMERNISLVLMNQHFSMEFPRAWLPEMVEVGGLHCRPPLPLPDPLLEFVEGSEGFIYFSFGSLLVGSQMDPKLRDVFLSVFGSIQERVVWKWETETMDGVDVPKNVKLVKWVPQQDILGHPKCRLFITQGGMMSQQEGIYHGVPMLVIPFLADQEANAMRAIKLGFGLKMELDEITPDSLHHTVSRLLDETQFCQRVEHVSSIHRDQIVTPMELAIFWTEYVIRHKGAPHLRSVVRDMPWYQLYLLDVILFIAVVVTVVLAAMYLAVRAVVRMLCGKQKTHKID